MLEHLFMCKNCGKTFPFKSYGFKSHTQCPHCNQKYIVVKNFLYKMIEVIVLITITSNIFLFILPNTMLDNTILTLVAFAVILLIGNLVFDSVMAKGLKVKNYYTLIEKTMPLKNK